MTLYWVLKNLPEIKRFFFSPERLLQGSSFHADKSRREILEHHRSRFPPMAVLKGFLGTYFMPVLWQMILDSVTSKRASLCFWVNTPGFSHHSLNILKQEGRDTDLYQAGVRNTDINDTTLRWQIIPGIHPFNKNNINEGMYTDLSPWRFLWNWVAMRQANRGPTRPPRTKGSATPPIQTSMLSVVP